MADLIGLDNVRTKKVECAMFRTASEAIRLLREYRAVTATNDYGAINVWVDDDWVIRAERQYFMKTMESISFHNRMELREWLKEALHKIATNPEEVPS